MELILTILTPLHLSIQPERNPGQARSEGQSMQDLQRQKIWLKRRLVMGACCLLSPTVPSEMLSTITGSMVRPVHQSQIRSQTVPVKRKDREIWSGDPSIIWTCLSPGPCTVVCEGSSTHSLVAAWGRLAGHAAASVAVKNPT